MTRIVHLTASTFFGGPERQMLGLAEHLRPDIDTTFVSFSENGRCEDFLRHVRQAEFTGVELDHDSPAFRQSIRDISVHLVDADVLFTHGYKASLLGRIAARRAGVPVIGVSRGWTAETWKVRLYERLDRWNLKRLDHVVCVSRGQAEKVLRTGVNPRQMTVIHNSARLADFEPRRSTRPRMTVLAAGRLSPEKGFQLLPAIAEKVGRVCPEVRFQMAGDGPLRANIETEASKRGVTDRIEFLGFRSDIDRLMSEADVLLLPSFTEGLPNVVLEAAAAGIPSVATRVGGTPEAIIDGQTGWLVPSGDVNTMSEALIRLAKDPARRSAMGDAARENAEANFSFAAQASAYRQLIDRLGSARKSKVMQSCG
ncbi:glycosyltransferase [Zavarzinella formosa]|uniref:glycosyltransferase n=1 Tax=Zavarzinella formosa TaxID=360055 RepID=UPI001EE65E20|nr:glycosyltransferase [Zavarzinella formosa]